MLHLFKGPELSTHNWEDGEEKKSPAPSETWTHDLSLQGVRSTAVLQLRPGIMIREPSRPV